MTDLSERKEIIPEASRSSDRPGLTDRMIGMLLEDRYRIVELIGAGGWGNVYKAKHLKLDMDLAVKVVHPHLLQNELRVKRFEQEAHLLSKIENEHIVRIIDHGLTPAPFMVMEYFAGIPLANWLRNNGPMPAEMAIDLFLQLFDALAAAETLRIVHRDLKPSNILLTTIDGAVHCKILDFGIAKFLDPDTPYGEFTKTGEVLGSPAYMSPEQWKGQCDYRSDIYALGCIMYEVLAGRPPFSGSGMEYMYKHISERPPAILQINQSVKLPAGLEDIVNKCMEKSPGNRYQSSRACIEDLKELKAGNKPSITIIEKMRRSTSKKVLVGVSILVLSVSSAFFWNQSITNSDLEKLSSPIQVGLPKRPEKWQNKTMAEWSAGIEANPSNSSLFYNRAVLHMMRRELGEANHDLSRAIELNPKYAEAYAERALMTIISNWGCDYDRAISDLVYARAILHVMRHEFGEALRDLTRAIELNPKFVEAYAERSVVHVFSSWSSDYEKALADANQAIALKPECAHGYSARAYVYECMEQHELAISDCLKAIELGEKGSQFEQAFTNVYCTLSSAYINSGRVDDAYKAAEAGSKVLGAKYEWLLCKQKALALCRKQEFAKAISALIFSASEPDCLPYALSLKSYCLAALGKKAEAEEACYSALQAETSKFDMRPPFAYWRRAEYWRQAGAMEKAIQDCNRAINQSEGKCYFPFRLRALCNIQQGRLHDALADLNEASSLNPYSAKTLAYLAMVEDKLGEQVKAEKDISRTLTLSIHTPEVYVNRASIEFDAGMAEEALRDLNHAIGLDPYLKEAFALRKTVYAKLGREREAKADAAAAARLTTHVEVFTAG